MIYEYVDWDSFIVKVRQLAHTIKNANYKPDIILGISRGGLIPATILSHILKVKRLSSIQVEHYDDEGNELNVKILSNSNDFIQFDNILVVDDVADSGKTLKVVKDMLETKNVKLAVVYYKPWSNIVPDFYVRTTKNWIIFPWELEGRI